MDNRSYDPDLEPKEHVDPATPSAGDAVVAPGAPSHDPVDPHTGVRADPTVPGQLQPQGTPEFPMPQYPEATGITESESPSAYSPQGAIPPSPAQSPYAPSAYPPPNPGGPLPPAPPEQGQGGGGFNWLACCGVSCGLGLVLILLLVFVGVKFFKPLINAGVQLGNITQQVKKNGAPAQGDVTATPEQLSANPKQYEGHWVDLTGKITDDPGPMLGALQQKRGMNDSAGYVLDNNILVLDISGSQLKAQQGDTIHVVGKVALLDLDVLGPIATREVEKENKLKDLKSIIYVITDKIQVVGGQPEAGAKK